MTADRKLTISRTFSSAFAALDDYRAKSPADAGDVYAAIVAHVRSSAPQALLSLDTGPVVLVAPAEDPELAKLRAEVTAMRPAFVAALVWREAGCTDATAMALVHAIDAVTEHEAVCGCAECAANGARP